MCTLSNLYIRLSLGCWSKSRERYYCHTNESIPHSGTFCVIKYALTRSYACPDWSLLNDKCAIRFGFDPKDRKGWKEAEAHCISKGGHLASVANATELEALERFCFRNLKKDSTTDCAVGLHRNVYGAFVWTDGLEFNSTLEENKYMSSDHSIDLMHLEGFHKKPFLLSDPAEERDPFLYVCGMSALFRYPRVLLTFAYLLEPFLVQLSIRVPGRRKHVTRKMSAHGVRVACENEYMY